MTTELCAYTVEACRTAARCGVQRVELCASPAEGGTTPSAAAIRMARRIGGLQLAVMIRPRGGDFLYSQAEFRQMVEEVQFVRACGADFAVFGFLTADGCIDEERTRLLVEAAAPMPCVFHRAFDMVREQAEALEAVIRSGCVRILTSGGCNRAEEGAGRIAALVAQAAGRIEIMAGSGVNPSNAVRLAATGVDALHFSARGVRESGMRWRNPAVSMGGVAGLSEYELPCVDEQQVQRIVALLREREQQSQNSIRP